MKQITVRPGIGFPAKVHREALALYASGLSGRAVVAKLREAYSPVPSQESVCQWVKAAGILRTKTRANELRAGRTHGKDYDQIRRKARALAARLLWSPTMIARHLGVQKTVVLRALRGTEYRLNGSEATQRRMWQAYLPDVEERRRKHDQVLTMREQGRRYCDIAEATGLSIATISAYLRRAGLTKPQKSHTRKEAA